MTPTPRPRRTVIIEWIDGADIEELDALSRVINARRDFLHPPRTPFPPAVNALPPEYDDRPTDANGWPLHRTYTPLCAFCIEIRADEPARAMPGRLLCEDHG